METCFPVGRRWLGTTTSGSIDAAAEEDAAGEVTISEGFWPRAEAPAEEAAKSSADGGGGPSCDRDAEREATRLRDGGTGGKAEGVKGPRGGAAEVEGPSGDAPQKANQGG